MKTLHFFAFTFLLCALLQAQNTPLQITNFNSATGAVSVVASITGVDKVYAVDNGVHPCDHGAIAPEQGWFIFIGKPDSAPYSLYTVSLADGHIVYSTPAPFAGLFVEYYYSDTIDKLVGIYTDTASGQQHFASCDLQTGAINQLAAVRATNAIATYSHSDEVFYFLRQYDTTLYKANPVSGQIDSVALLLNNYLNFPLNTSYTPQDLQYDEIQHRLLALCVLYESGPPKASIIDVNTATGVVASIVNPLLGPPNQISSAYYNFAYDEAAKRYVFGFFGNVGQLYSASTIGATDTTFPNYGTAGVFLNSPVINFAYNYVTQKVYGLQLPYNPIIIPPVAPAQTICKVTVDSTSTHNVIVWEKLDKQATDSFRIFRETSTNQYTQIATIPRDSLSEYHDYGANPNITGYRYKISVKDTNGTEGRLSPYHNTLHLQYLGSGNLIWNAYEIFGANTPVASYDVMIDASGSGIWSTLVNVPGTQTTTTDINFSAHTNARYRLVANWSYNCVPTRSSYPAVFSNVINLQANGLETTNTEESIRVYPNPASGVVEFLLDEAFIGASVIVTDVAGRRMATFNVSGRHGSLITENWPTGVYIVALISNNQSRMQKLIINNH